MKALTITIISVLFIGLFVVAYIIAIRFNAQEELARMRSTMLQLETVKQSSGFSWTNDKSGRENSTVYTDGQIQMSESELNYGTEFRLVRTKGESSYIDFSGEVRSLGNKVYLSYLPPGPEVPGFSFENKNTWVSFDMHEFMNWGPIIPGLHAPAFSAYESEPPTMNQLRSLQELLLRADILYADYDGTEEIVRGQKTRVINARFAPESLKTWLITLFKIKNNRQPNNQEMIQIIRDVEILQELYVKLWIGKKNHLLYRAQAAGFVPKKGNYANLVVDIRMEFSDFNKKFVVKAPSNSVAFANFYKSEFGFLPASDAASSFLPSSKKFVSNEEARLPIQQQTTFDDPDTDNDGLSMVLEAFYRTNPNNPDSDGDGVSDGQEVLSGSNPNGEGTLFGFGVP